MKSVTSRNVNERLYLALLDNRKLSLTIENQLISLFRVILSLCSAVSFVKEDSNNIFFFYPF